MAVHPKEKVALGIRGFVAVIGHVRGGVRSVQKEGRCDGGMKWVLRYAGVLGADGTGCILLVEGGCEFGKVDVATASR